MKRYRYVFGIGVKLSIILIILIWIAAAVFAVLKLTGVTRFVSLNPGIDITTIVLTILFDTGLIMLYLLHYKVTDKGIALKLGWFDLFGKKMTFDKINTVIYKVKAQKMYVCPLINLETPRGTIINISPVSFNAFVEEIRNKKVEFDYIEDID